MTLKIRPYQASDRTRVREICFQTGLMGDPVAGQYSDLESFADLFTRYYTDHEPQHCFVVDDDGDVVGYLLGTLDSRRVPSPERIILGHIFSRALPVRGNMMRFFLRSTRDTIVDGLARTPKLTPDLARFPAHTHFNLIERARQAPIAAGLYRSFFLAAKKAGCPGIHGEVFAENARASALHVAMGFAKSGPAVPVPGMRNAAGQRLHVQLWTRSL